ncbi:MAG: hypothetical protein QG612_1583 [Pseudomonadota bacterium]|nr:hypothetical protein [Pseudomonadota bacterium]
MAGAGLSALWRSLTGGASERSLAPVRALPIEPTHYQCLGLPEDCTLAEVEIAWHQIRPGLLPARAPGARPALPLPGQEDAHAEQTRSDACRLAHAVLTDPDRRAVYDAWLAHERALMQPPPSGWMGWLAGR